MPKEVEELEKYNDQLVKRGELLIDLDLVENWEKRARGDVSRETLPLPGRPDRVLAFPRYFFRLPFRQEEGFVEALAKLLPDLGVPKNTTMYRRINGLWPKFERSLLGLGAEMYANS